MLEFVLRHLEIIPASLVLFVGGGLGVIRDVEPVEMSVGFVSEGPFNMHQVARVELRVEADAGKLGIGLLGSHAGLNKCYIQIALTIGDLNN